MCPHVFVLVILFSICVLILLYVCVLTMIYWCVCVCVCVCVCTCVCVYAVDYTHVRGRGWKCLRRGVREWSSLVIYISQGTGGQVWRKSTCVYILIDHSSKFTQYIYNSGSQCRTGGQVWRKSTCAYILIDIDFQSCRCTGWILKNDTEEIEFLSSRVSWSVFSLQTKWECTTRNVV
jgi:hypothetical protein